MESRSVRLRTEPCPPYRNGSIQIHTVTPLFRTWIRRRYNFRSRYNFGVTAPPIRPSSSHLRAPRLRQTGGFFCIVSHKGCHEHPFLQLQLQLGHLADAFIQSDLHRLTHRRQSQPCKATASSSGAVRVKCLAQGHINTQLGGAES